MRRFLAILPLLLSSIAGAQTASTPVPPAPAPADTFMYNEKNKDGSSTLKLVTLVGDKVNSRNVMTTARRSVGTPVCTVGGKIYSIGFGNLTCLDVATGQFTQSDTTAPFVLHDGLLYCTTEKRGPHLRLIDLASQSYSDAIALPDPESTRQVARLLFSPDGKHIAYVVIPQGSQSGGAAKWRIGVIDFENRHATTLLDLLPYQPPSIRILAASPDLIAWRDNHTLLTVTNDGGTAADRPQNYLTAIDITTKRLTRLDPLPVRGGGVQFFPPETVDGQIALILTPQTEPGGRAPERLRLAWEHDMLVPRRAAPITIGKFECINVGDPRGPTTIKSNGRIIIEGSRFGPPYIISPDGNRLLYIVSGTPMPVAEGALHLYNAVTQQDLTIGPTARTNTSYFWLDPKDLTPSTAPATPPPGFQPLTMVPVADIVPGP